MTDHSDITKLVVMGIEDTLKAMILLGYSDGVDHALHHRKDRFFGDMEARSEWHDDHVKTGSQAIKALISETVEGLRLKARPKPELTTPEADDIRFGHNTAVAKLDKEIDAIQEGLR